MLVIDDSKLKLLKMKGKMLELSQTFDEKLLNDYHDLVIDVDNDCYQMIIKEIKDSNYNNLPLEEQITVLRNILDDYNYLNELQCIFRNTYSKYTDQELNLNKLDNILLDNIQIRISQIEGYLMNIKNLKSNKIELDRLNQSLITAIDGKKKTMDMIDDIQMKLRSEVLNARGRIYDNNDRLEATDISKELINFGINLSEIVNDNELLNKTYSDALNEKKEKQETLNIALALPNRDDAICGMYMFELLKSNYKLTLVELIKEIYHDSNDYYLFKDSLYKIEDLIKEIKNNLRELNVKFYINPFDQIKISSYIAVFEKCKDYEVDINTIKRTMTYLTNMVDEMEKRNNDFLLSINDDVSILKEDINTLYLNIPKEEVTKDDGAIDELLKATGAKENQVAKISKPAIGFMKSRVKEKTDSVIKRVYDMFCKEKINEIVPELVIEKQEEKIETPVEEQKDDVVDLFQEVVPFTEPVLFDERKDEDIFSNSKDKEIALTVNKPEDIFVDDTPSENTTEVAMPELFWTPKDEKVSEEEKSYSFDEQINELIKRR